MLLVRPMAVDDAALLSSSVDEDDHTAWNAGTAYAKGVRVRVVATDYHKVFESQQDGNTGHDPADDDGTWWIEVGPTNRWALFDGVYQTQTEAVDEFEVQIQAAGRIDTVGFQNISGSEVQVTLTDAAEGVVYDETFSLVSTAGIDSWAAYFFEPLQRKRDLTVTGLPMYANPIMDIAVRAPGGTAKCGELLLGQSIELGGTRWGANVGIRDYSRKDTDDFGRTTVIERTYSKRGSFQVVVRNTRLDLVTQTLADYRATPVLFIGSDEFGAMQIYGYARDWGVDVAYPDVSILGLEVEGLT